MHKTFALVAGVVGLSLAAGTVAMADTHPFSVHDMLAMDRIAEPRVSPDGKNVVFSMSRTDLENNRRVSDLWLVGIDGTGLRRLTDDAAGEWDVRWSPDGAGIYFVADRGDTAQVWYLPLGGGEAEQKTDLPVDVGGFLLSPDGKTFALAVKTFPDCPDLACTRARLDERAQRKATGVIFDRLMIRHWDTWADGRRSHLFTVPAAGGKAVDVMKGMDADTPSVPFGDMSEVTFTPDGRALVFSTKDVGREEAWSTDFDLYEVPVDGSAPPTCLTESNEAWDTTPVFSPDGKTLAYLAMARPGYESDRFRVVLMDWATRKTRILTEDWDHSPGTLTWGPRSRTLYVTAPHLGQVALFSIDVKKGRIKTLFSDGTVRSPSVVGKRVLFGRDHLRSPVELYTIGVKGKGLRQITFVNKDKIAAARMGEPEQFTFQGWNNEIVYAYVVKPVDFDPSKKYPVAFLIHGGPQGSFGNDFHYRWNPQAYAGAGYAAVMVDFHGSTGYGQAFTDSIRGDWGGKPLEDLKKGLAAALERYPWMDGDRVAALGASYGGYMINWIAGNWPDRFRCLVCHDGNLDERMAYYDTEELWFPEWDHQGTPWDNPEGYTKQNPVEFVKNWKTPMLVIHGQRDYRVAVTQGISTFTALQRRGIPSKFLYFPDENHWVLSPQNSILWHETVIDWLNQWTSPEQTAEPSRNE